jgi:hypothetical protein
MGATCLIDPAAAACVTPPRIACGNTRRASNSSTPGTARSSETSTSLDSDTEASFFVRELMAARASNLSVGTQQQQSPETEEQQSSHEGDEEGATAGSAEVAQARQSGQMPPSGLGGVSPTPNVGAQFDDIMGGDSTDEELDGEAKRESDDDDDDDDDELSDELSEEDFSDLSDGESLLDQLEHDAVRECLSRASMMSADTVSTQMSWADMTDWSDELSFEMGGFELGGVSPGGPPRYNALLDSGSAVAASSSSSSATSSCSRSDGGVGRGGRDRGRDGGGTSDARAEHDGAGRRQQPVVAAAAAAPLPQQGGAGSLQQHLREQVHAALPSTLSDTPSAPRLSGAIMPGRQAAGPPDAQEGVGGATTEQLGESEQERSAAGGGGEGQGEAVVPLDVLAFREQSEGRARAAIATPPFPLLLPNVTEAAYTTLASTGALEIGWEELRVAEELGAGAGAAVFKAVYKGVEVAVKRFHKQDGFRLLEGKALQKVATELKHEVAALQAIRSARVVRIHGV